MPMSTVQNNGEMHAQKYRKPVSSASQARVYGSTVKSVIKTTTLTTM